jgi:hypothetical protein
MSNDDIKKILKKNKVKSGKYLKSAILVIRPR